MRHLCVRRISEEECEQLCLLKCGMGQGVLAPLGPCPTDTNHLPYDGNIWGGGGELDFSCGEGHFVSFPCVCSKDQGSISLPRWIFEMPLKLNGSLPNNLEAPKIVN